MRIFEFIKDVGEKLVGRDDDQDARKAAEAPVRTREDALADRRSGEALARMIGGIGLPIEGLDVRFREGKATIAGKVPSVEVREKIILIAGNTQGVAQVEDQLVVEAVAAAVAADAGGKAAAGSVAEAVFYTVAAGDTLGKIAQKHYGRASKYTVIFEANKPMLTDPDKIKVGQVLRIPPLEG